MCPLSQCGRSHEEYRVRSSPSFVTVMLALGAGFLLHSNSACIKLYVCTYVCVSVCSGMERAGHM